MCMWDMRFHGKLQSSAVLKLFLIFDNKRRDRWRGMPSRWIQDELESDGGGRLLSAVSDQEQPLCMIAAAGGTPSPLMLFVGQLVLHDLSLPK